MDVSLFGLIMIWSKLSPWSDSLEHDANTKTSAVRMNIIPFQNLIMAANIEKKPIFVKCAYYGNKYETYWKNVDNRWRRSIIAFMRA